MSYVEVKPNVVIKILRSHYINGYTLQYLPDIHGVQGQLSPLTDPAQLKHIFRQLHDFLVYSEAQHKDIETLNQWLNHGTEKQYITGLGIISRLVLAKYVNDPLYHDLVAEAAPIFAVQQPWRAGHRLHIAPSLENLHVEVQKRLDEMLSL